MNKRTRSLVLVLIGLLLVAGLVALALAFNSKQRIARLTVLVSGYTHAYIKNCGCSSGQKGGEVRKARLIKEERAAASKPKPSDKGLPAEALVLEIGNFTDPSTAVNRVQSQGVVEIIKQVGFQAVGLGLSELQYSQSELYELLDDKRLPVTAANLAFTKPATGEDKSAELTQLVKPYIIARLHSGYRVGIVHILDRWVQDELPKGSGYQVSSGPEAAQRIVQRHRREADQWILSIANPVFEGTDVPAIAAMQDFSLVVGASDVNPLQDMHSKTALRPVFIVKPYDKAKDLVRAVAYFNTDSGEPTVTVQRLTLSDSIAPDPDAQAVLDGLQADMERIQNEQDTESLRAVKHPVYMGTESCRECHEEIVVQLEGSKHVHAYEALETTDRTPNAHKSGACLPCHVVGHSAGDGKRWSGGWNIFDNQPEMRGVQCENCHGPAEYHILMEKKDAEPPADLLAEGRDQFGMQPATKETCVRCHDATNSPKFKFEEYWPKIDHTQVAQ